LSLRHPQLEGRPRVEIVIAKIGNYRPFVRFCYQGIQINLLWLSGDVDQARITAEHALATARKLAAPFSIAVAQSFLALVLGLLRDQEGGNVPSLAWHRNFLSSPGKIRPKSGEFRFSYTPATIERTTSERSLFTPVQ
jgi:hypothetical protein